jgi:adenylate kinase family enzyme
MKSAAFKKITVVGNIAGGKTRLSESLSQRYDLSLIHVDSIQFVPDSEMQIRPLSETREIMQKILQQKAWLIDGYGPLDLLEARFALADKIVFVDLPLWRHYWWCSKRQLQSLWSTRKELPEGCREASLAHTVKLYKTIWRMHKKMRPELLKIFAREDCRGKMLFVRNLSEWNKLFREGF